MSVVKTINEENEMKKEFLHSCAHFYESNFHEKESTKLNEEIFRMTLKLNFTFVMNKGRGKREMARE